MITPGQCRFCGAPLRHTFVDLGAAPIPNDYLTAAQLSQMEPFYPLHVKVCGDCFLVQVADCISARQIFGEHYAYFSSFSDSWLAHAKTYVEMITTRLALGKHHHVIEVACNDGYLLQYFVAKGIPVLGIEPTANTAEAATKKGIPTVVKFLGEDTAQDLAKAGRQADLLIGNNVLAHVPDINDFVEGLHILLKPTGVLTMEFPHLLRLMSENQFDTIYHEHYQYLSLLVVEKIFGTHGLTVFDVEELPTHGGSLRIYACHSDDPDRPVDVRVGELKAREEREGMGRLEYYRGFGEKVMATKRDLLDFLIRAKREGKRIAGYGAPGKGNTLLNYCGIRADLLEYTVDRNPYKHGKFLPGTHIPIFPTERIRETRPDYLLVLPWNLRDEITAQLAYVREWGCRFVIPIPEVEVV